MMHAYALIIIVMLTAINAPTPPLPPGAYQYQAVDVRQVDGFTTQALCTTAISNLAPLFPAAPATKMACVQQF